MNTNSAMLMVRTDYYQKQSKGDPCYGTTGSLTIMYFTTV